MNAGGEILVVVWTERDDGERLRFLVAVRPGLISPILAGPEPLTTFKFARPLPRPLKSHERMAAHEETQ
jgi:hypothetical protein